MTEPPSTYSAVEWAGDNGRRWAAHADQLEAQLEPVNDVLFAAADVQPGEAVVDVGCGRGTTTRRAALAVGPAGAVTAVDISPDLVDAGRSLATDLGPSAATIDWMVADAQQERLPEARFDLVLSRFGVMFFADAPAAFANLARTTAPGGRLCAAVWPHRDQIDVFRVPLAIAVRAAADLGHELTPPSPDGGPFSLSDPATVADLLAGAGWTEVRWTPHDLTLHWCGPGTIDDAVATGLDSGPVRTVLDGAPDDVFHAVRAALTEQLATRHDGTGVALPARIAIIQAVRPA